MPGYDPSPIGQEGCAVFAGVVVTDYLIRLPWPEQALWQNRRVHWAERSKAVKAARRAAWALAKEQGVPKIPGAILMFEFYPPDNRRRDIQNMPATQKAAIDGIADAMGCDDHGFRPNWPDVFAEAVHGGAVVVHVRPPVENIELRGVVT